MIDFILCIHKKNLYPKDDQFVTVKKFGRHTYWIHCRLFFFSLPLLGLGEDSGLKLNILQWEAMLLQDYWWFKFLKKKLKFALIIHNWLDFTNYWGWGTSVFTLGIVIQSSNPGHSCLHFTLCKCFSQRCKFISSLWEIGQIYKPWWGNQSRKKKTWFKSALFYLNIVLGSHLVYGGGVRWFIKLEIFKKKKIFF